MRYTPMSIRPLVLAFCCAAVSGLPAAGETLESITVPGTFQTRTYTKVTILGVTEKGVKITHSDGLAIVPVEVFPADVRAKLNLPTPAVPAPPVTPPAPAPSAAAPAAPPTPSAVAPSPTGVLGGLVTGNQHAENIILVNGEEGSGTAFLAKHQGKTYLYTAIHVLGGLTKTKFISPKGDEINVPEMGIVEVSDDDNAKDVVRMILPGAPTGTLELSEEVNISAPVLALGNSKGKNVITSLEGKIAGLGPAEIEIDVPVVPGNSGGPIILAGSNKVVGLVTHAVNGSSDVWTQGTPFEGVRRFAAMPSRVAKWTQMTLHGLRQQGKRVDSLRGDTRVVATVLFLNYHRDGVTASAQQGDFNLRDVLKAGAATSVGQSVNSAIAGLNSDLRLGSGTTLSAVAAKPLYGKFFGAIFQASKSGVAGVQPTEYVRFYREKFKQEAEIRKAVVSDILKLSNEVQTARFR